MEVYVLRFRYLRYSCKCIFQLIMLDDDAFLVFEGFGVCSFFMWINYIRFSLNSNEVLLVYD